MHRFFQAALAVVTCFTASAPANATDLNTDFYISASGKGALYILRINDVNVWTVPSALGENFTVPVSTFLRSGENTVALIQVPYWGAEFPYGTPNPHYQITVELRATDRTSRASTDLTLLNTAFDMETGKLFEPETTAFGTPRKLGLPDIKRGPSFEVVEAPQYRDGKGPPLDATRVKATFTIPYDIAPAPYADGEVMTDTPELRADLHEAYQRVHGVIKSGDREALLEEFREVWEHAASVSGYRDAAEFARVGRAFETLAPISENGDVLMSLSLAPDPAEDAIQFMAEGRLVRIVKPQIAWADPESRESSFVTSVVFYRTKTGDLRIGEVLLQ